MTLIRTDTQALSLPMKKPLITDDTGVGLCLLLPKAYVLQKFVDICLNKDVSVHFVFTCPSNTSEFEASAWLYNLLHDKVQHIGFMQNLGITFLR